VTADVTGKTVLVTGSTDGLGRALALELAATGATVLLHGRDPVKGEETVRDIREATGSERLAFYHADLGSLSEVRGLVE
jgi:NAD(P)-dependent dehydrogenase (short-subunit alcohol dehydrogenase family)